MILSLFCVLLWLLDYISRQAFSTFILSFEFILIPLLKSLLLLFKFIFLILLLSFLFGFFLIFHSFFLIYLHSQLIIIILVFLFSLILLSLDVSDETKCSIFGPIILFGAIGDNSGFFVI